MPIMSKRFSRKKLGKVLKNKVHIICISEIWEKAGEDHENITLSPKTNRGLIQMMNIDHRS